MTFLNKRTQTHKTTAQLLVSLLGRTGLLALTCSFSVLAADNSSNWYDSTVTSEQTSGEIVEELTTTVTNIAADDSRIGWKLNVGFDVTNNVAIEAGYMDLNDTSGEMNTVVSNPERFFNNAKKIHPNSAEGFTLGSVYHYNITDNIDLTGSVGLFNWEGDAQTQSLNSNPSIGSDDLKGTDLYFGLGGGYQLSQDVTLSIEWERYQLDDDNAQMWSIGVNYHFK